METATRTPRPWVAALQGILLLLPFLTMNAIVGERVEPFFSLIRPGLHTSAREYVLLMLVILLIPIGAYLAARPIFQRQIDGSRRFYVLNALLAMLLCAVFIALSVALGSEIYRCDILGIPNCD